MRITKLLTGALALAISAVPAASWADDPRDPAMQSRAARERDAAEVRRLNREQARYVQQRDASYVPGWRAHRDYPAARADYERRLAEWRHAVRLCDSGRYEYCQH